MFNLKRRHDVIPKLIDAIKQYAAFESATLEAVTQLRTESEKLSDVKQKGEIETAISHSFIQHTGHCRRLS